jgi:hypothetical protein
MEISMRAKRKPHRSWKRQVAERTQSPFLERYPGTQPPPYSAISDEEVVEVLKRLPADEQEDFRRNAREDLRAALDRVHFVLSIGVVVANTDTVGFATRWHPSDIDDPIDYLVAAYSAGLTLLTDPEFVTFSRDQPPFANMIDGVVSFVRSRVATN